MSTPLRIAIAVHGRFHAFDVARTLSDLGHDVTVFTNYPRYAGRRFNVDAQRMRTFPLHAVLTRSAARFALPTLQKTLEPFFHRLFGGWARREISKRQWDVVDVFSGVAEEILSATPRLAPLLLMERGSCHIRTHAELLIEESERTGYPQELPSTWMVAREEREYAKVDHIVLLSEFARRTFEERHYPPTKMSVVPLGVNANTFRATPDIIEQRIARIRSGTSLHILYVGRVGFAKGFKDHVNVIRQLPKDRFQFTFVGSILPEIDTLRTQLTQSNVQFIGHVPQEVLKIWYNQGDIFYLPTIQDGFAMVLAQAQINGLPIIASTNCAASDFLEEGKSGWIVPIRQSEQTVALLQWCDTHRAELAQMVSYTYQNPLVRDWTEVGRDYQALMYKLLKD